MYRISKTTLPIVLLIAAASYGQSLADVARQNRATKDQGTETTKKVYTTDDLSPSLAPEPSDTAKTPEQWSRQILAQKTWVAYLQAQADRVNASTNNGGQSSDQAAKAQEQLAKEKEKLGAMQQAAFDAGMPDTVYNPKKPVRFMRSRRSPTMLGQH
ncbi:MAG TPA: hypothetical protein VKH18_07470 [Terriglobales bacterium]|nr:hypothetical protein [Terriglobales bacterium]